MAARVSSPRLIGRRRELDALIDAIRGLGASDRRVVLIGGEAGIGKSRLIAELPGALRSAGEEAQLIRGTCVELTDGTIPFGPVLELLEELEATVDEAALAASAGRLRDELAGSVDGETSSTPGSGGMRRLVRLHDLLAAVAGIRTLVVAIDELHWADHSTLDLNREIATRLFISDKAASVHVTHILDKMRVSSRTEAALLAARAGLAGSLPDAPESP